ncbi:MAG: transglutaminase domain-containing protein [Planctomycetia bacterium]|nr:transglutaminase domain-containing protein [Planctomycetia bacterium]
MHSFMPSRWCRFWAILALALVSPLCPITGPDLQSAGGAETAGAAKAQEIWEAFYLQNAKIGYGQTTIRPAGEPLKGVVQTESLNKLIVVRFGQRTEQELKMGTTETSDGRLLAFRTEISFGPSPMIVNGRVEGQQMVIESSTKGSKQTTRIPWTSDIRGFRAIELSLEQQPLTPGQKRTLKMLMPVLNQVAEVELTAHDHETTSVMGGKARLLRVESVARLPDGNSIASTLWTDALGQTIKTRVDGMQQESFRTSRELAIAEQPSGANFDLGNDVIVKLDKPLANAHATRQVRYRVELTGGDPARVFATGSTQAIRSLGPHAAELTVRSLRPGDATNEKKLSEPVAKEYSAANSTLQTLDPRVKAMAQEAKGSITNPRQLALALEHYVYRAIAKKNFTQAFATAAEVAASREGDCTEHAVLLAALARACQIPSRVAIGLVYVDSVQGFGYHMWTEVYIDGRWIALDATLGQGGIGAAHLKLTDSSLDGAAAYSSFLPVAQVVGQLKVSVLAVE